MTSYLKFPRFLSLLCMIFATTLSVNADNGNLKFTENKGQWNSNILFRTSMNGGALFLEPGCLTFNLLDTRALEAMRHGKRSIAISDAKINGHAYKIQFKNCNQALIKTEQEGKDYENYYLGNDPSKWRANVKNYATVWYENIYKGIDYEIGSGSGNIKYNFHVKPHSNPAQIQLVYEGIEKLEIIDGQLYYKLSVGEVKELKPYAFQRIGNVTQEVACRYKLDGNTVSFEFPGGYNSNYALTIDPVLVFAAQSGSSSDNFGTAATYDSHGNLYSAGCVYNNGYPITVGSFSGSFNGTPNNAIIDVVITKFNSSGTSLLYSTYFGGTNSEIITSIIVDHNDNLCMFGLTSSADLPVTISTYDGSFNGGNPIEFFFAGTHFSNGTDIFLAKINSNGSALIGSTYFGGSDNDGLNHINHTTPIQLGSNIIYEYMYDSLQYNYGDQFRGEIQIDAFDNIYIASSTRSSDFPTVNAYDNSLGGKQDAIVAKFNPNLSQLIYSTYLGGSLNDCGNGLIVNSGGEVYVTGGTCSTNFPITNGAQSTVYSGGKSDGFIAHLNATGNLLLNSTFVGTNVYDQSFFIQSDKQNNLYILGQSLGNIPVVGAGTIIPHSNAGTHQFICRYDNSLSMRDRSTVFGHKQNDVDISPNAFGLDKCNSVYLAGFGGNIISNNPGATAMSNMPLLAAIQSTTDGFDAYYMALDSNLVLQFGSYFGGNFSDEHVDGGMSRFDQTGTLYQTICAGCGGNDDFPVTTGSWPNTPGNPNHSGNCNAGIVKLAPQNIISISSIQNSSTSGCAPLQLTLTNASSNYSTFTWYLPGGTNTTSMNPILSFSNGGSYTISLVVSNPASCNMKDSSSVVINVSPNPPPTLTITASTNFICIGETVTLTASGASNYTWSSGGNSPNTVVSPTSTTVYTLTGADQFGCSNTTTYAQIVDLCTGLKNNALKDSYITVFPNPAKDQLEIQASEKINEIHLYNTLGQELLIKKCNSSLFGIDMSIQKAGVYFIKIQMESGQSALQKIIKE